MQVQMKEEEMESIPTASPKLINYLNQIEKSLESQIQNGETQIGEHSQNICNPEKMRERVCDRRLEEIKEMKEQLLSQISALEHEQSQIKKSTVKKKKEKREKNSRSFFTEEEKSKISETKKKHEKQIQSRKERIAQIMRKIAEREEQLEKEKLQISQSKKKARIVKILQKRHKTDIEKSQQRQCLSQSKIKVSKKNYIYFKNIEKDKEIERERGKYNSLLLKEKRQRMKINFKQIKQHSIVHDEIVEKKKREFSEELSFEIKQRVKSLANVPQTEMLRKAKKEMEQSRIMKEANEKKSKEQREKIIQYREYVSTNFIPKSDSKSKFSYSNKQFISPNLSPKERFQKGNQYLNIAKERAKKNTEKSDNSLCETHPTGNLSSKYPNYIENVREQNKKRQAETIDVLLREDREINKMRKAEKALKWVRTREEKQRFLMKKEKNQIGNVEVQSVKDKIKILETLMSINI